MKATSRNPKHWRTMAIMTVAVLVPSLIGFGYKFHEFVKLWANEEGAFTIVPIVNYLLATVGFFFLFAWAIFHGMFRDIENPKHAMLQHEFELEEEERLREILGH